VERLGVTRWLRRKWLADRAVGNTHVIGSRHGGQHGSTNQISRGRE
jgi:hypothetical protein